MQKTKRKIAKKEANVRNEGKGKGNWEWKGIAPPLPGCINQAAIKRTLLFTWEAAAEFAFCLYF